MHLVAERFVFIIDSKFLKEVVKTNRMAPMSPLNSRIYLYVFTSTVCGQKRAFLFRSKANENIQNQTAFFVYSSICLFLTDSFIVKLGHGR